MKKLFLSALVLLMIISFITPVYAAPGPEYTKSSTIISVNGRFLKLDKQPISVNGVVLVPAKAVFKEIGATVSWYPKAMSIKILRKDTNIFMMVGDRRIFINGRIKNIDTAPVLVGGTVMVPLKYIAESLKVEISFRGNVINIGSSTPSRGDGEKRFIVVVDAGHGGWDNGARYGGVNEKDLNLDIAKRLNELLAGENIKTYMTRNDDTYVGLYERSALANNMKADLLISVHNNAEDYTGRVGSMSLYYPGTGNYNGHLTAYKFAQIVQNHLTGTLGTKDLGVIERPKLAVLRTSNMPAVIAEVGYMSNPSELAKLKSGDYRQKAAEALRNAVLEALGRI